MNFIAVITILLKIMLILLFVVNVLVFVAHLRLVISGWFVKRFRKKG